MKKSITVIATVIIFLILLAVLAHHSDINALKTWVHMDRVDWISYVD